MDACVQLSGPLLPEHIQASSSSTFPMKAKATNAVWQWLRRAPRHMLRYASILGIVWLVLLFVTTWHKENANFTNVDTVQQAHQRRLQRREAEQLMGTVHIRRPPAATVRATSEEKAALQSQGSSVWCTGDDIDSRKCRFENICYSGNPNCEPCFDLLIDGYLRYAFLTSAEPCLTPNIQSSMKTLSSCMDRIRSWKGFQWTVER